MKAFGIIIIYLIVTNNDIVFQTQMIKEFNLFREKIENKLITASPSILSFFYLILFLLHQIKKGAVIKYAH